MVIIVKAVIHHAIKVQQFLTSYVKVLRVSFIEILSIHLLQPKFAPKKQKYTILTSMARWLLNLKTR